MTITEIHRTTVSVPIELFDSLLSRIDDLPELKVVLLVARHAALYNLGMPLEDLLTPPVVRLVVGLESAEPAVKRMHQTLDRAVANGSLLRIELSAGVTSNTVFLLGVHANRVLADGIRNSERVASAGFDSTEDASISISRPNVFSFYEQHIGPLSPLVAEHLREAERSYPRAWIEEAILTAVHYNKRSWRYVESVLGRWEEQGGPDGIARGRS